MKKRADAVIIGGGVCGCGLAYCLAKRGFQDVVVVEREYLASGATGRCGGGIRQQWSTEENARLAMESVRLFQQLDQELDYETEFTQGGYLILAYTEEEVEQYKRNVAMQQKLGLDVRFVDAKEAREIAPHLNTDGVLCATHCPSDGSANPFFVTQAYAEAAKRLGVQIELFAPVVDIKQSGGKIRSVITPGGEIETPLVVNAAGGDSVPLARMAGLELPIVPTRHEIMVTEPVDPFFTTMVISFRHGVYFRQERRGGIIMGYGDPEEEPGFMIDSSLNFLRTMSRKILSLMPALHQVKVVRQWAGLYDTTPDALPILGPVDQIEDFIQVNGFSGHGFMLAPKVVDLLAQFITGEKLDLPIDRLHLSRFESGEISRDLSVV
ncbi:NAD(P)/FAD-dependent oxidoreductase [Candidatus Zixiibacteriota bacterium]